MEDRYPYIRFVIGAAPLLAGTVAGVLFLGGTITSCSRGGFAGFVSFLLWAAISGVAWTGMMVWIESMQLFIDIEENTRKLGRSGSGSSAPPAGPSV